jgi:regulator of protease activity HflC (stomatin/prohibitin superfamily)
MKNLFMGLLMAFAALSFSSCTERIDAGHEGILVNLYGTGKGVSDVSLVTGRVWYNPWTEDVYEFPTFVQTIDYEAFSVNAKGGSIFMVDPVISYSVIPGMSPAIFNKYRVGIDEISEGAMKTYVKNAFKNVFNSYTSDSILSKREKFDNEVTLMLEAELEKEGFHIEQLTFGMTYPESLIMSINAKEKSIQDAIQASNQLVKDSIDAKRKIIEATAEKQANELRQSSLTPMLIQQQFIDKWDGKTPLYGSAPTFFKNVQ